MALVVVVALRVEPKVVCMKNISTLHTNSIGTISCISGSHYD